MAAWTSPAHRPPPWPRAANDRRSVSSSACGSPSSRWSSGLLAVVAALLWWTARHLGLPLQKPQWRIWLDRLIQFQLDTAQGHASLRTRRLLDAINELSEFLDGCVGGGNSIGSRQIAEES
jgi:hypothetical protein